MIFLLFSFFCVCIQCSGSVGELTHRSGESLHCRVFQVYITGASWAHIHVLLLVTISWMGLCCRSTASVHQFLYWKHFLGNSKSHVFDFACGHFATFAVEYQSLPPILGVKQWISTLLCHVLCISASKFKPFPFSHLLLVGHSCCPLFRLHKTGLAREHCHGRSEAHSHKWSL